MTKPLQSCPECGAVLDRPARSSRHHRRLFGLITAAFHNWPENCEFQPESAEHLRAWLLVKAGHRETREIPVTFLEEYPILTPLTRLTIEAVLREAGPFPVINPNASAGTLSITWSKSIAWSELDQRKFSPIAEAVEQTIEQELGVTAEQLLREKAA